MSAHKGASGPQARPHPPQLVGSERSTSQPSEVSPLQSAKPGAHSKEHPAPSQRGEALGVGLHAVQSGPQAFTELTGTQTPLQRWKPSSQATPHTPEEHVARA